MSIHGESLFQRAMNQHASFAHRAHEKQKAWHTETKKGKIGRYLVTRLGKIVGSLADTASNAVLAVAKTAATVAYMVLIGAGRTLNGAAKLLRITKRDWTWCHGTDVKGAIRKTAKQWGLIFMGVGALFTSITHLDQCGLTHPFQKVSFATNPSATIANIDEGEFAIYEGTFAANPRLATIEEEEEEEEEGGATGSPASSPSTPPPIVGRLFDVEALNDDEELAGSTDGFSEDPIADAAAATAAELAKTLSPPSRLTAESLAALGTGRASLLPTVEAAIPPPTLSETSSVANGSTDLDVAYVLDEIEESLGKELDDDEHKKTPSEISCPISLQSADSSDPTEELNIPLPRQVRDATGHSAAAGKLAQMLWAASQK